MTRMWMVNPSFLCRNHLLGEHKEIHQLAGTIKKGISIRGYLDKNLVEPQSMFNRHEALVLEMVSRGYSHRSPLEYFDIPEHLYGNIDIMNSQCELFRRCSMCYRKYLSLQEASNGPEP